MIGYPDWLIILGDNDIGISDNCNINNLSYTNKGSCYE